MAEWTAKALTSMFNQVRSGAARRTVVYSRVFHHLAILIPLFLTFYPLIFTLQTSFKSFSQFLNNFWLPSWPITLKNYAMAWNEINRFMLNSAFVAALSLLGVLLCSSLAAYAFARIDFFLRDVLYYLVIALLMIPSVLTLIGRYLLIARLGLMNSLWGLIFPYISGGLAFGVFFITSFFADLPQALFDSARIDGATEFQMYRHIALPMSKPTLSTVGLLSFLSIWGDYVWPLLVLRDREKFTLILGLANFTGSSQVMYGPLMAGYVIGSIPTAIMILLMMRTFTGAALAGTLK